MAKVFPFRKFFRKVFKNTSLGDFVRKVTVVRRFMEIVLSKVFGDIFSSTRFKVKVSRSIKIRFGIIAEDSIQTVLSVMKFEGLFEAV